MLFGLVNMQRRPGEEREPKRPKTREQPKGTGSRADWAFCTKDKPCGRGEGDCDNSAQCGAGLECGVDNCRDFHPGAHRLADCCVPTRGQCVIDTPLRLLTHYVDDLEGNVTPENCIEACTNLAKPGPEPKIPGYILAGVEAGNQCFCGNTNISSSWNAPASDCNTPCSGNSEEICGGAWRMNIYETGVSWSSSAPTKPSKSCPTGWKMFKSNCYKVFKDRKSWGDAGEKCVEEGGELASIESSQENDFLVTMLSTTANNDAHNDARYWIGASDRAKEGTWMWSDGTAWKYTNWDFQNPSNSGGGEDCLEIWGFERDKPNNNGRGTWNDNACNKDHEFICKMAAV